MKKEAGIENKQKTNIGKKILFAIVLPIVIIFMIIVFIFTISGKNIFEEASNIPIIGSLFSGDDNVLSNEDLQRQINQLKATLSNEQAKVNDLEMLLAQKEQEIEDLKEEKEELENTTDHEIVDMDSNREDSKDEFLSIVKTYENMKPKNAAAILISMDESTALNILSNMREKNVAAILEKMPSENAANFTSKLLEMQQ